MSQRDPFTPLAITGLGCLFPGKPGTRGFWNTVLQGIDQIRDIPADRWKPSDHFDPDPSRRDMVYAARGAFLSPVPFSPAEYGVTPASLEATDTAQLLGLHVARQALLDAGYAALPRDPGKPLPRDRASVIVGVTSALELLIPLGARLDHPRWRRAMREAGIPEDRINDALARIASTYPEWTEDSFPGLLGNVVAGRIASRFDLHGTNCVVDAACASSLAAVHQAAMELQSGRADIVVTGGIDTFTDVFMYACFSKTPALSRRGEARPFAADADGTILGEGLGLVVLKRLPDALRDGDAVHAVIKGLGTSSDGRGQAIYAPAREGQARAVRRAWAQAGVGAGDIGLVEAHGTGTKAGDGVELSALLELFGKSGREGPWCALGSVKSQIGHAKGAAGAAGLVKAALALRHRVLPPTLKTESERAEFAAADSPFFLPRKARHWPAPAGGRPRRAAVSAFGFGGSNFHAVLEEHGPPASPAWDGSVEILAWGAADWPGIESSIAKIPDPQGPLFPPFARMCRESFDPSSPVRLAVAWAGGDREALLAACREAIAAARDGRAAQGPARAATGPAPRRPVLLFPGQGSQKTGMFRELACVFPEVAAELDAAAAAMAARFPEMPALDRIVDPVRATASDTLSTDTRACQAALAATGLGAARLLERFGIGAWAACGHSLGELPALAWAGRLPAESMHHLVAVRSGAMRDAGQSFAGAMAAVLAPRDRVVALLASDPSLAEVVPANHNGPEQVVISGPAAAIEAASRLLESSGHRVVRLEVAGAFHHPRLAPASDLLSRHLATEPLGPAAGRVVLSGFSGAPHPADPALAASQLARQLSSEIRFVSCLQWLLDNGADLFIESGPGKVLSGLASRLGDKPAVPIDPDPDQPGGLLRLARALAHLAALGVPVRLSAWESPPEDPPAPTPMTVPLSGANHMKPRPAVAPLPPLAANPAPIAAPSPPAATRQPTKVRSEVPSAMSASQPSPGNAGLAREAMALLARMHEDNARLHRQFLETQESAQRALMALVEGRPAEYLPAAAPVAAVPVAPPPAPLAPAAAVVPSPAPVVPAPVPAAAPARAAAPVPPAPGSATGGRDVLSILRSVISEKTGYPVEALGEDLALDADLGIDSIKRVEILAGVSEKLPDAPAVTPDLMGTLRTLRQLAQHLSGSAPVAATAPQGLAPAVSPAPGKSAESALAIVRSVVAEKTGYPVEALGEDLALDADLGIDSIKRVEILAGVSEKLPDAPAVTPDLMGTLRTLRQLAQHLSGSAPVAATAPQGLAPAVSPAPGKSAESALAILRSVVAEKTGYPVEALGEDLALDADLGIDSIKRVEILAGVSEKLPDAPAVTPDLMGTLRTLRQLAQHLSAPQAPQSPATPEKKTTLERHELIFEPWTPGPGPLLLPPGSRVLLAGDQPELARELELTTRWRVDMLADPGQLTGPFDGLVLAPGPMPASALAWETTRWLQAARAGLSEAARKGAALLAGVVEIDGAWGGAGGDMAERGLISGALKTAAREWPGVVARLVDRGPGVNASVVAEVIGRADTPVEIGLGAGGFVKAALRNNGEPPAGRWPLNPGDTVVVTGGGRGVTTEVAVGMARVMPLRFILLGRTPIDAGSAELATLADEPSLVRAFLAMGLALPSARTRAARLLASREVERTLSRLREAGSSAEYVAADVTDPASLSAALAPRLAADRPARAIVHGAGVLADARIESKTAAEVARVWNTKVAGLENLLRVVPASGLSAIALFGSITGRLGRAGQLDYAMANAALACVGRALAHRHPGCRVVTIDWGPWRGGMVDSALARLFDSEGVGLIEPAAGGAFLPAELALDGPPEVLVVAAGSRLPDAEPPGPAPARARPEWSRTLAMSTHAFLEGHVLDGRAVLPFAVALEWMAHTALLARPGQAVATVTDVQVLKGIVLAGGESAALEAVSRGSSDDHVDVALRCPSDRAGLDRYRASFAMGEPGSDHRGLLEWPAGQPLAAEDLYPSRLFHGAQWRVIESVEAAGPAGMVARLLPAPSPARMMENPLRGRWIIDPWALDGLFQAAIICAQERGHAGCLPSRLGRLELFGRFPAEGCRLVMRVTRSTDHALVADAEFLDASGNASARVSGLECTIDPSLARAFRHTTLRAAGAT